MSIDPAKAEGTFHGGFVRDKGDGKPSVRIYHPERLKHPQSTTSEVEARRATMTFEGGSPPKARQTKLACLGIPTAVLEAGTPEYARTVRLANTYKKARAKELYLAHGFVSSGVGALLASASLALSGARYLYELAANTPITSDRGQLNMPQLLKMASSLSDSARQNELAAWELCAREAVIRKRNDANMAPAPWMVQSPTGEEKRGRGRPRKVHVAENEVDAVKLLKAASMVVEDTDAGPSTD